MDTIVLRKGNRSFGGKLQHKTFSILTDVGLLKIPKKKIAQIFVNVPAYNGKDAILTFSSVYHGELQEDPIRIKLDDSGELVEIPQAKILAIHCDNTKSGN